MSIKTLTKDKKTGVMWLEAVAPLSVKRLPPGNTIKRSVQCSVFARQHRTYKASANAGEGYCGNAEIICNVMLRNAEQDI